MLDIKYKNFIAESFNCTIDDIVDLKPLECSVGGLTNVSWTFSIKIKKTDSVSQGRVCHRGRSEQSKHQTVEHYILRIPGANTDEIISRKNECLVYNLLGSADITDEIIAYDDETGLKIAKFYHAAQTLDAGNDDDIQMAVSALKHLHCLKITDTRLVSNDMIDKINEYMSNFAKTNLVIDLDGFDELYRYVRQIIVSVEKLHRPKFLTHGDTQTNNMLKVGDKIRLIDLEYAGLADPLEDVALFVGINSIPIENIEKIYRYYVNIDPSSNDDILVGLNEQQGMELVKNYLVLGEFYNVIWAVERKAHGSSDVEEFLRTHYKNLKEMQKK